MKLLKEITVDINKIINDRDGKGIPVLTLKDAVVYPGLVKDFKFGRDISVSAIKAAEETEKVVFVTAQRQPNRDYPKKNDLFNVGCLAYIAQTKKISEKVQRVMLVALTKAKCSFVIDKDPTAAIRGNVTILPPVKPDGKIDMRAIKKTLLEMVKKLLEINANGNSDLIVNHIKNNNNVDELFYRIAGLISESRSDMTIEDKQLLLEESDITRKLITLARCVDYLRCEAEVKRDVQNKLHEIVESHNKQAVLRKQIEVLQSMANGDGGSEIEKFKLKIKNSSMPEETKEKAYEELDKLGGGEHPIEMSSARNWLNTLLALPWDECAPKKIDPVFANKVLTTGHFGLEKPKERILEYLAVQRRTDSGKLGVLCLNGSPGVGKTSLSKKIAEALKRPFFKISLGGVADEAELRGHRKTYVASTPGSIINCLLRTKVNNPVVLLDEIDKIRDRGWGGSASAALLEILDPEQNTAFKDHFLDIGIDISNIMFICTANSVKDIHPALLDRLDTINIDGYTEEEKLKIARGYIVPKQFEENGIASNEIKFTKKALQTMVRDYTRESGVRALEREIAKICRKVVHKNTMKPDGETENFNIDFSDLTEFLGPKKFNPAEADHTAKIGCVTGLAYTNFGGDILPVHTLSYRGKGRIEVTGNLGDIIKESAKASFSLTKFWCDINNIDRKYWADKDFHVHVGDGSTPKEGPSAGVAMVTALISAITGNPVRGDIAMTGEVDLLSKVCAIGGVKEKLLAAHRYGIKNVILPHDNEKNVKEIEADIKGKFDNIYFVKTIDELFKICFTEEFSIYDLQERQVNRKLQVLPTDTTGNLTFRPGAGDN